MNSTHVLHEKGFSQEEIAKLVLFKETWDKQQFETALLELRRLEFYRFLYKRGDLNETKVSVPAKRQIVGIRRFLRENRTNIL